MGFMCVLFPMATISFNNWETVTNEEGKGRKEKTGGEAKEGGGEGGPISEKSWCHSTPDIRGLDKMYTSLVDTPCKTSTGDDKFIALYP